MEQTILWLPGRGVGKGRPRFSPSGRVYTGDKYGKWKREAVSHLRTQYIDVRLPAPCEISCYFVNFLSSDSDNLIGSVLDALVQAELIQNDSSSFVTGVRGYFTSVRKPKGKDRPIGILISAKPSSVTVWDYEAIAPYLYI